MAFLGESFHGIFHRNYQIALQESCVNTRLTATAYMKGALFPHPHQGVGYYYSFQIFGDLWRKYVSHFFRYDL